MALAADYRARVEIVALEAPPAVVRQRNRSRRSPVPESVLDRLIGRWEAPDLTEAHTITWAVTG